MNIEANSDTWCPHPYKYLMVAPDNLVKPCCRYRDMSNELERSPEQSPLEIYKGDKFSQIRNKMKNSEFDPGCSKCQVEEDGGLKSMRQRVVEEKAMGSDSSVQLEGMEVGFSRVCNLKCRTCNSHFSTQWELEDKRMNRPVVKFKKNQFSWTEFDIEDLKKLKTLKITGGEPFLSKEFFEFIEYLESHNLLQNIEAEIFTNATVVPKPSFVDKLLKFKKVNLNLSIDAYDKQNSYIRNPADWKVIEKVFRIWRFSAVRHSNLQLQIAITVSMYSIFGCLDLVEWIKSFETPVSFGFQLAAEPDMISLYGLPEDMTSAIVGYYDARVEKIAKKFNLTPQEKEHLGWVPKALKSPSVIEDKLGQFFNYTKELDSVRTESFEETFPILSSILLSPQSLGKVKQSPHTRI